MKSRFIKSSKVNISDTFEKKQIFLYLATFLSKKSNIKEYLERIGEWYYDYGSKLIRCPLMNDKEIDEYGDFRAFARKKQQLALKRIDILYQKVLAKIEYTNSVRISPLQRKIDLVAELLRLTDIEKEILGYYVRLRFNACFINLMDKVFSYSDKWHTHCPFF